ncbi:hypothetical protein DRB96_28410 [Streptomyces sp. ICC1]|nr:hypothetical protein DRB89_28390 [Streptomyces sp. ICC4]AWZ15537.1 hypothetical protein DRB96_28410 [Streptomyces sp. ICC1]
MRRKTPGAPVTVHVTARAVDDGDFYPVLSVFVGGVRMELQALLWWPQPVRGNLVGGAWGVDARLRARAQVAVPRGEMAMGWTGRVQVLINLRFDDM